MRAEALEVLAIDAASDFAELTYDSNWLAGMAIYAQACASLDEPGAAASLHRLLSPWRDHVAFNSATTWGLVQRHLGNLERVWVATRPPSASCAARQSATHGWPHRSGSRARAWIWRVCCSSGDRTPARPRNCSSRRAAPPPISGVHRYSAAAPSCWRSVREPA